MHSVVTVYTYMQCTSINLACASLDMNPVGLPLPHHHNRVSVAMICHLLQTMDDPCRVVHRKNCSRSHCPKYDYDF